MNQPRSQVLSPLPPLTREAEDGELGNEVMNELLLSVFHASVLLLIINFVITLSK